MFSEPSGSRFVEWETETCLWRVIVIWQRLLQTTWPANHKSRFFRARTWRNAQNHCLNLLQLVKEIAKTIRKSNFLREKKRPFEMSQLVLLFSCFPAEDALYSTVGSKDPNSSMWYNLNDDTSAISETFQLGLTLSWNLLLFLPCFGFALFEGKISNNLWPVKVL